MKTEKQPSPASPARNYLQAVSRELRAAAAMQGLTINDLLTEIYSQQAACGDWGTFAQWKKQGYRVQKGESGFAVWSRPMKNNDADDGTTTDASEPGDTTPADDTDGDGKKEREFFRVAYIFNARQVASREGLTPSGDEYQPTGLTPPHLQQAPAEPAPTPAPQPQAEAPTPAEPQPTEAPTPQPAPATAPAPQYIEQLALAI